MSILRQSQRRWIANNRIHTLKDAHMRLNDKHIWIVRDPSAHSEIHDIVWSGTYSELICVAFGTGQERWHEENVSFFDNEEQALCAGQVRLAERDSRSKQANEMLGELLAAEVRVLTEAGWSPSVCGPPNNREILWEEPEAPGALAQLLHQGKAIAKVRRQHLGRFA